ncbi:MAG: hypothetical protein HY298_07455 [Verrucomicrobia bacterium]|nr:hypothetical protein [Verrucomicrobiota bacterium]
MKSAFSLQPLAFSLCLSLLISLLAISHQSLWIDEAWTAVKAREPTLAGWWQAMAGEKASDLQMPLYMVYMWGYEKIFGSSEWILRSANIPWFVLGIIAFVAAVGRKQRVEIRKAEIRTSGFHLSAFWLVPALSPFAWYYLNEARPYAMQFGASLLIFAALYQLSGKFVILRSRRREEADELGDYQGAPAGLGGDKMWVIGFCVGIMVLCGSSLLGMIWAASAVGIAALTFSRQRIAELWRAYCDGWLITGCFILFLSAYYLWTLKAGARASGMVSTDWKSICFIGYELLGFGGLGPGRLEIRQEGLGSFQSHWIGLALYGIAVLSLVVTAVRKFWWSDNAGNILKLAVIIAAPAVALVIAGLTLHFRIVGRHFTPLMPVILFLLSTGLTTLWCHRSPSRDLRAGGVLLGKLVVGVFCCLSLLSCLSLRFAARHEKDDYRSAAALARTAINHGQQVWWNADPQGAAYYQVPLRVTGRSEPEATSNQPETGSAWWVMNPSRETLVAARLPDVIVVTKPDLYDRQGALADYVKRTGYRKAVILPAFTIWQRAGPVE